MTLLSPMQPESASYQTSRSAKILQTYNNALRLCQPTSQLTLTPAHKPTDKVLQRCGTRYHASRQDWLVSKLLLIPHRKQHQSHLSCHYLTIHPHFRPHLHILKHHHHSQQQCQQQRQHQQHYQLHYCHHQSHIVNLPITLRALKHTDSGASSPALKQRKIDEPS